MKPNFALDLSHEGINLLHRSKGGWSLVGSVALDDPEMGAHLHQLRRTAAMLESGGITTKLIIPDSQILYTTVDAPGPDDISREVQIRAALDGLTPYPVGELVFDWRADGEQARVAVLARETMDEAEGFAAQYKFNPVSFAARPARGTFSGEPFFGKSRIAAQILAPGERVEPDANPVPQKPRSTSEPQPVEGEPTDTASDLLSETDAGPVPEPATEPVPELDDPFTELDRLAAELAADAAPEPAKPAPKPRQKRAKDGPRVEAPVLAPFPPTPDEVNEAAMATPRPVSKRPAKPAKPAPRVEAQPPVAEPDEQPAEHPAAIAEGAPLPPVADEDDAAEVSFSSRRTSAAPTAPAAEPGTDTLTGIAPRIGTADKDDTGSDAAPPPSASADLDHADRPRITLPPAPAVPNDPIRADMAEALAKPLPRAGDGGEEVKKKGPSAFSRLSGTARGLADRAGAAAAAQRAKRDARKAEAAEAALAKTTPPPAKPEAPAEKPRRSLLGPRPERSEADRQRAREAEAMTVFGARKTQAGTNRPKYLGLILTLLLLLAMAAVAIWSSFIVDDGQTSLFNPSTDTTAEASETPAAPIADGSPAAETPDPAPPQPPATAEVLSPEAAQARYAATGIWQRAPDVPSDPETPRLDALDPGRVAETISTRSPTPLPDATGGGLSDAALADPVPPPPPGTTFVLDENGLVVPKPEGALSPTGILVYAGRPATVPPTPPSALLPETTPVGTAVDTVDTAIDAAVDAVDAAVDTALTAIPATPEVTAPFALPGVPGIRPQPRPATIPPAPAPVDSPAETVTTDDNATLIRPNERPEVALAVAVADTAAIDAAVDDVIEAGFATATELAVPASVKPNSRPRNFDKLVAAAQTSASDGSQVIAAVATVTPAIPTSASVATRATTENALNLRRINLIGIYGSSSSRRALVRMSNGRYVKVEVGDRLDGGKVTSISASKLTYQKGNRAHTLEVLPLG